jgi:hypothetical protein
MGFTRAQQWGNPLDEISHAKECEIRSSEKRSWNNALKHAYGRRKGDMLRVDEQRVCSG